MRSDDERTVRLVPLSKALGNRKKRHHRDEKVIGRLFERRVCPMFLLSNATTEHMFSTIALTHVCVDVATIASVCVCPTCHEPLPSNTGLHLNRDENVEQPCDTLVRHNRKHDITNTGDQRPCWQRSVLQHLIFDQMHSLPSRLELCTVLFPRILHRKKR